MKKILISFALVALALTAAAQEDPIVMRINGVPVPRSEFEYNYNKNNSEGVIDKKSVEEYADLFVNYKLKVQAALDPLKLSERVPSVSRPADTSAPRARRCKGERGS